MITVVTVFFAMLSNGFPEEEDVLWLDYSASQRDYAETVAMMGLMKNGDNVFASALSDYTPRGGKADLTIVLCRTDGRALDPSGISPLMIAQGPSDCYTLLFNSDLAALKAVDALNLRSGILYAELDAEVRAIGETETAEGTGEEIYTFASWGAAIMQYDSYIDFAKNWGSGYTTVAVIDSGVAYHAMINDHIRSTGYDYIDADDDPRNDEYGHGTGVAGIIVDCVQTLPVRIYPIRILGATGRGSVSNLCNGIREAITEGVDIINLSLELAKISEALDDAIEEARRAGITVVVAAGNHNIDTESISPAHIDSSGVIVVGATSRSSMGTEKWAGSNYGVSVDLYVPGESILCCSPAGGMLTATGTSMAAPHITALCAMMKLIHPGLAPSQLEMRVTAAVDKWVNPYSLPSFQRIIPNSTGFCLNTLHLTVDDEITLPTRALPETAFEKIQYESSDESIVCADNGKITAIHEGNAVLSFECTGIEAYCFDVIVSSEPVQHVIELPRMITEISAELLLDDDQIEKVILPEELTAIGDRAFKGCTALCSLYIPATVEQIGTDAFEDTVLFVYEDSAALQYAIENEQQYITLFKEQ